MQASTRHVCHDGGYTAAPARKTSAGPSNHQLSPRAAPTAQRGTQTPRVECYLVFTRDVMTSTTGLFLKDEGFIFSVGPVLLYITTEPRL